MPPHRTRAAIMKPRHKHGARLPSFLSCRKQKQVRKSRATRQAESLFRVAFFWGQQRKARKPSKEVRVYRDHQVRNTIYGRSAVLLIIYFIAITLAANVATYFIGLLVEHWIGSAASLIVFLTLYFLSIWMAWVLAVRLTAPTVVAADIPAGAKAKS